MSWSPDGRWLACGCGGVIRVWDGSSRQEVLPLRGNGLVEATLAWSPDGKRLASWAGPNGGVRVWDFATREEVLTLPRDGAGVTSVAWSPDGKRLASQAGGRNKLWDILTGQEVIALSAEKETSQLAWSPDGRSLASGDGQGVVHVWEAPKGREAPPERPLVGADLADRQRRAESYRQLGNLLRDTGRLREAEQAYRDGLDFSARLVADSPATPAYRKVLAGTYYHLGWLLAKTARQGEAEAAYRQAMALQEGLGKGRPALPDGDRISELAKTHHALAELLQQAGRYQEAARYWEQALQIAGYEADWKNDYAWLLATCPDAQLRNPTRAVELATAAVKQQPWMATCWNTLGVAQYRAGNWNASVEALERAVQLTKGGTSFDFFFLAMSHWQLGDKEKAREWYARGVSWMEANKALQEKSKPQDEELRHFRGEAAELLGVTDRLVPNVEEGKSR
jgi:tetratricopeptide (TPR) repeat protein